MSACLQWWQTLLRPLHDWAMKVLSKIPTDGTYAQLAPLERLKGKKVLYSFDLKSATDLLPVDLTGSLLAGLFGDDLARTWTLMMGMVAFRSPEKVTPGNRAKVYRFTRGPPLGYYSSWPLFTLTHHMLVWWAAYKVYPGKRFMDYAILGDDIVIADEEVALAYKKIMDDAMAVISVEKSLISHNGVCEFAKRLIVDNHLDTRADISPVSLSCIQVCSGFVSAFVFKQLGASFRTSFRLRGGGYRVFSRLREPGDRSVFLKLSRRWRRHWLTLFAPSSIHPMPYELWLAFPEKGVLTTYEMGKVRAFILDAVKPRDIDEQSIRDLRQFWGNDSDNMVERQLKSFIKLHLDYLSWYCKVLMDPFVRIEILMNPPIAPRRIARESEESELCRYV